MATGLLGLVEPEELAGHAQVHAPVARVRGSATTGAAEAGHQILAAPLPAHQAAALQGLTKGGWLARGSNGPGP